MAPRNYKPTRIGGGTGKFTVRTPSPFGAPDPNSIFPNGIPNIVPSATKQSLTEYVQLGRTATEGDFGATAGGGGALGTFVALGDSIFSGGAGWEAVPNYIPNYKLVFNGAVQGRTTADILFDAASILALNPSDWLVFDGGGNDIATGVSVSVIYSNIQDIANIGIAAGRKVCYMTTPPFEEGTAGGSWTVAVQRKLDDLHARVARWMVVQPDMYFAEPYTALLDPAIPARDFKLFAYRATGGIGASHLSAAGATVAGNSISSVMTSKTDNSSAVTARAVLARYTAPNPQDSNAVGSFVFRLARLSQWPHITEVQAYRQSTSAANALIGMKSKTATLEGVAPVYTAKQGFACGLSGSIDTKVSSADTNPDWATTGKNVGCVYGGYFNSYVSLGANAHYIFGDTVGPLGAVILNLNIQVNRVIAQIHSFFASQQQVAAYANAAAMYAAVANIFLAIGRIGPWTATANQYIRIGDVTESAPINETNSTTPPNTSTIWINGYNDGVAPGSTGFTDIHATMFFAGTDSVNLDMMKFASDALEAALVV